MSDEGQLPLCFPSGIPDHREAAAARRLARDAFLAQPVHDAGTTAEQFRSAPWYDGSPVIAAAVDTLAVTTTEGEFIAALLLIAEIRLNRSLAARLPTKENAS